MQTGNFNAICLTVIAICMYVSPVHLAPIGPKCRNRLDLVFVIDSTSSESAPKFADVKAQVKGIVSRFEIGKDNTRLGLVTASSRAAQVVARFNDINSLSDFNSALDRVNFDSSGPVDLAEGIRVARDSVLSSAPRTKVSKILVVVKDRRWQQPDPADAQVRRDRVQSEASRVKSSGTAVQAVGIGGIWTRLDLVALFGTDYLMFKNVNKAAVSIKSLNNQVCEADCPENGLVNSNTGLCFGETRSVVTKTVALTSDSSRLSVCRREISSKFEKCSLKVACDKVSKDVGSCIDGKVKVWTTWQSLDHRTMQCTDNIVESEVDCKDAMKCKGQKVDIIFILDRSSSLKDDFHHVKSATKALMQPLDVGPDGAHVSIITFANSTNVVTNLRAAETSEKLLAALDKIQNEIFPYGHLTFTGLGLDRAIQEFKDNGRPSVPKFVFLITDGDSTNPSNTFAKTAEIKNLGVNIYAIGVGAIKESELRTMTEPESNTNLIILKDINQLRRWSYEFAKKMCVRLSAPDPKLCEDNVFVQSISECFNGNQQVTKTEYKFDSKRQCLKSVQTVIHKLCRSKCIDPLSGSEYFEGDTWKTRCHEFRCQNSHAKPFLPVKSECVSASGTCHAINSAATFKCIDEKGVAADNCRCMEIGGKPVLVIDSY